MLLPALCLALGLSLLAPPPPAKLLGPALGHVGVTDAFVWARAQAPGPCTLYLFAAAPGDTPAKLLSRHTLEASPDHDLCLIWKLDGLEPATRYSYLIRTGRGDEPETDRPKPDAGGVGVFRTLAEHHLPRRVNLVFGSCDADPFDQPQPIWTTIARENPDALCLIGDTPYIDSTDLPKQREKYRGFVGVIEMLSLRRTTPTYAVWDDHDFGMNDTDGNLKGKQNARQAFIEYHASGTIPDASSPDGYGENNLGAYTSFRNGPVEVFLLDARWFSRTEPSFAKPGTADQPSLLGAQQWTWLKTRLKASSAAFKLLVTGMVWNDSVRDNKTDYWGAYPWERSAVFDFIADEKIPGVILVGGDIHRSRAFKHLPGQTGERVTYPLYELVSSPLAANVHVNPNKPHPALLFDRGEPRSFVVITADSTKSPATLTARWLNAAGEEFYKLETSAAELTPK